MAAWRYEISLLVLKKYFTRWLRSFVKYFSTLERNFVSPRGHLISIMYHTGMVGMQLPQGYDEPAQIQDAVSLVASALGTLLATGRSLTPPPASCRETAQWDSGKTLFE